MNKEQVLVDCYYDDYEVFYILPSGFENKVIVVNESPVDLFVSHAEKGIEICNTHSK